MECGLLIYVSLIGFCCMPTFVLNGLTQEPPNKEKQMTPNTKKWTPAEQELWDLEQTYMQYLATGNVDSMMTYYHEKFVGWPSHSAEPVNREAAEGSLRGLLKDLKILAHKFQPCAMVMYEKTAIVHYMVELKLAGPGDEEITTGFRIIHTWIKEDGKWKILGGMSAEAP